MLTAQVLRQYLLDRIVLRPTRHWLEPGEQRRVGLNVLGRPLECFVHGKQPVGESLDVLILKFPGTAGRAERSSSFPLPILPLDAAGQPPMGEVWTWNPPGYGRSSGRATMQGISAAAVDFARQVIERRVTLSTKLLLVGNSLGCAPALHVAASDICSSSKAGLILRNPPPLTPVVRRVAESYPLGRLVAPVADSVCDAMNVEVSAAAVNAPIVFLQSELDTLVPPLLQHRVHQAHGGPQKIVNLVGLEHDGIPDQSHSDAIVAAVDWLWKQLEFLDAPCAGG